MQNYDINYDIKLNGVTLSTSTTAHLTPPLAQIIGPYHIPVMDDFITADEKTIRASVKSAVSGVSIDENSYEWRFLDDPPKDFPSFIRETYPETVGDFRSRVKKIVQFKVADTLDFETIAAARIRTWNRPIATAEPPTGADVSWYQNTYAGIVGEPIKFLGYGELQNTDIDDANEQIQSYIWDWDNNWATTGDQEYVSGVVEHTWREAKSFNVGLKVITNYGIKSVPIEVPVKIYAKPVANAGGPYNSRPNEPVKLFGSIEQYYGVGAVIKYIWTFEDETVFNEKEPVYKWVTDGDYRPYLKVRVTTPEGMVLESEEPDLSDENNAAIAKVHIESGKPNAYPGGPYVGGIKGGAFSPIQLLGNDPSYVESEDVGNSVEWQWDFDGASREIWTPDYFKYENNAAFYSIFVPASRSALVVNSFKVMIEGGVYDEISLLNIVESQPENVIFDPITLDSIIESADYINDLDDGRRRIELKVECQQSEAPNRIGVVLSDKLDEMPEPTKPTFFDQDDPETPDNEDVDSTVWNPTFAWEKPGTYTVALKVKSQYGKWSDIATTKVTVLTGSIAGYVRAADLRTPVKNAVLTLKSTHVDMSVLGDRYPQTPGGYYFTETDENGYYKLTGLPLGNYIVTVSKVELATGQPHEFSTAEKSAEITVDGPNQAGIDFVDTSVFPVGGRIVYSIKKNGGDVLVEDVIVKAQSAGGSTSTLDALPSKSVLENNMNYKLPLFAGEYTFTASVPGHTIELITRNDQGEPLYGYDSENETITISSARTDIHFVDTTTRTLTVKTTDSADNPIPEIRVQVSGKNGEDAWIEEAPDENINDLNRNGIVDENENNITHWVDEVDENGNIVYDESGNPVQIAQTTFILPPGEYTVEVLHPDVPADEKTQTINLEQMDGSVTFVIPLPIVLTVSEDPIIVFDVDKDGQENDLDDVSIKGILPYNSSEPIVFIYTVTATTELGDPVNEYTLTVHNNVSMTEPREAEDYTKVAPSGNEIEIMVDVGIPAVRDTGEVDEDGHPIIEPLPKSIKFTASKDGYLTDVEPKEDDEDGLSVVERKIVVLGDLPMEEAVHKVSVPKITYFVLHDPPGDGSYSYVDETMTFKGIVDGMTFKLPYGGLNVYTDLFGYWLSSDESEVKVYPSLAIRDKDNVGLIGSRESTDAGTIFYTEIAREGVKMITEAAVGPLLKNIPLINKVFETGAEKVVVWIVKKGASYGAGYGFGSFFGLNDQVQYEITPTTSVQTPESDDPQILGPGAGDVYYGEGWIIGFQAIRRVGIDESKLVGHEGETLDIHQLIAQSSDVIFAEDLPGYNLFKSDAPSRYVYTVSDIEDIIESLSGPVPTEIQAILDKEEQSIPLTDEEQAKLDEYRRQKKIADDSVKDWQAELNGNYAYRWRKGDFKSIKVLEGEMDATSTEQKQTISFSAGARFEYTQTVTEGAFISESESTKFASASLFENVTEPFDFPPEIPPFGWKPPFSFKLNMYSQVSYGTTITKSQELESGKSITNRVGFVLTDDDVGDNFTVYTYEDTKYGTPLIIADPGCRTSDPWEYGTNKNVLLSVSNTTPAGPFDYRSAAYSNVTLTFSSPTSLRKEATFLLHDPATLNPGKALVTYNGRPGPYEVTLSQGMEGAVPSATVLVAVYPPENERARNETTTYNLTVLASEKDDMQIYQPIELHPTFSDLKAPRTTIVLPEEGREFSKGVKNTIHVKALTNDNDIKTLFFEFRGRKPDGYWESWSEVLKIEITEPISRDDLIDGYTFEAEDKPTVTMKLESDVPLQYAFHFDLDISKLGDGEYSMRARAIDGAENPNEDIEPPVTAFTMDNAQPSVLTSVPDYQAAEIDRIFTSEISVTFNDDMMASSLTDDTFKVIDLKTSAKVAGVVSYSPALRKAVFVPIVSLEVNQMYRAIVRTESIEQVETQDEAGDTITEEVQVPGVKDSAGNSLDMDFIWTFRAAGTPKNTPVWQFSIDAYAGEFGDYADPKDLHNRAGVAFDSIDGKDANDRAVPPDHGASLLLSFPHTSDSLDPWDYPADQNYDIDIRHADGRLQYVWFVEVKTDQARTITLEWDVDAVASSYVLMQIEEMNTHEVTPMTKRSIENPSVHYTYQATEAETRLFKITIAKNIVTAKVISFGGSSHSHGWNLFSVPIDPLQKSPSLCLEDNLRPLAVYNYDANLERFLIYPDDAFEITPGKAYWVQVDKDTYFDVAGTPVSTDEDFKLELGKAGWHAVSIPYEFSVDITELSIEKNDDVTNIGTAVSNGWLENSVYYWVKSENDDSDQYMTYTIPDGVMKPWAGYWFKTLEDDLMIVMPPIESTSDTPAAPAITSLSSSMPESLQSWRLPLQIANEKLEIGVAEKATDAWDVYDSPKPPSVVQYISLSIDYYDWAGAKADRYAADFRSPIKSGESKTWEFSVDNTDNSEDLTLVWSVDSLPKELLVKLDNTVDMHAVKFAKIDAGKHTVTVTRMNLTPVSVLNAIEGEGKVELLWQDDNPHVIGYKLYRDGKSITDLNLQYRFVDTDVIEEQTYTYEVVSLFPNDVEIRSESVTATIKPIIRSTKLFPCYPNPFNPETWIPFQVTDAVNVKIDIYNVSGQLVRSLNVGRVERGKYVSKEKAAHWDGEDNLGQKVASGMYFYTLQAGEFAATRKMVILK